MLSALTMSTLGLFFVVIIPYQRAVILEAMGSETRSTATSISQTTATALINEEFASVVKQCLQVVRERPSISYVVVTRTDGYSLIVTKTGWKQDTLSDNWVPAEKVGTSNRILQSDFSPQKVFHYTHPFHFSGLHLGWIHIGLSLDTYNSEIRGMYLRTSLITLICLIVGIVVSIIFARKLTNPISTLVDTTRLVAMGDLTSRADIKNGDELEIIGPSFNDMAGRLQTTWAEMVAAREYTDNIIKSMNDTLIVVSPRGIIERANMAATTLLGYVEDELVGMHINRVLVSSFFENDTNFTASEGRENIPFKRIVPRKPHIEQKTAD